MAKESERRKLCLEMTSVEKKKTEGRVSTEGNRRLKEEYDVIC